MDKKQLIEEIAEETTLSKKTVEQVLSALVSIVQVNTEVFLRGLGKFKWVDRAARKARNPVTGESVDVPAKRVLVFKASK